MSRGGARPGAGRPKGSHEVAHRVRTALMQAIDRMEKGGKSLVDIMEEELQKDPKGLLRVMAQYIPKEQVIDAQVECGKLSYEPIPAVTQWLEEICKENEEKAESESESELVAITDSES